VIVNCREEHFGIYYAEIIIENKVNQLDKDMHGSSKISKWSTKCN